MEISANSTKFTDEFLCFFSRTSTRFMSPLLARSALDHVLNIDLLADGTKLIFLPHVDGSVSLVTQLAAFSKYMKFLYLFLKTTFFLCSFICNFLCFFGTVLSFAVLNSLYMGY
jgi:hypothetical protein